MRFEYANYIVTYRSRLSNTEYTMVQQLHIKIANFSQIIYIYICSQSQVLCDRAHVKGIASHWTG